MNQEEIEKLEGYHGVLKDIETARQHGSDFSSEKKRGDAYIDAIHPARLNLYVKDIIPETPAAKTLRLVPENRNLPPFQAGQYITLYLDYFLLRNPYWTGYTGTKGV